MYICIYVYMCIYVFMYICESIYVDDGACTATQTHQVAKAIHSQNRNSDPIDT